MKILFFVVVFLFSGLTHADGVLPVSNQSCKQSSSEFTESTNKKVVEQGCCSHHGGVCGCNGGRAVCCDGNFSPSCGCHADDIKQFLKFNEAEQPKS